jgi:hypothetical protein
MLVSFSHFLVSDKEVTVREEEVEGAETREMDKLGPHASSSPTSTLQSVSACQDINESSRPAVPQDEGVSLVYSCCRIPGRSFYSVIGSRGSDTPEKAEMNATTVELTQAEAQIRTRIRTIVEISNDLTHIYSRSSNS